VLTGPFAGVLYLNEPVWGAITLRWIGSHESCLWDVVREIIAKRYESILDVGCAEGYYAAGLCRASPASTVHAYDLDRDSLSQVERLWRV
jgi:protein-L-isoaspartate O-methyltransferase